MKLLIYFFSCFSLLILVGCSPEQKCFDAQMKAWQQVKPNGSGNKAFYWQGKTLYENNSTGKAKYEADAWARCMRK